MARVVRCSDSPGTPVSGHTVGQIQRASVSKPHVVAESRDGDVLLCGKHDRDAAARVAVHAVFADGRAAMRAVPVGRDTMMPRPLLPDHLVLLDSIAVRARPGYENAATVRGRILAAVLLWSAVRIGDRRQQQDEFSGKLASRHLCPKSRAKR